MDRSEVWCERNKTVNSSARQLVGETQARLIKRKRETPGGDLVRRILRGGLAHEFDLALRYIAMEYEATPIWSELSQGEQVWFLGSLVTFRVPGEAVDGRFALMEFLFPPGAAPPLHTHPQDESFIVLEGRLKVRAADQDFHLTPGGVAVAPAGVPHAFRVISEGARVLLLSTPAGLDRLYRDGGVPAATPTLPPPEMPRPPDDVLHELFDRHGQITVGPPLPPD